MAKNRSYICILEWMKNTKLSGNDLIVYAIVYGFSQDEKSLYSGSASYISEWIGISKKSAYAILNRLSDAEFLIKTENNVNGVKFCYYSTNFNHKSLINADLGRSNNGGMEAQMGGREETSIPYLFDGQGREETSLGGREETSHYNKIYNNKIKKDISKDISKESAGASSLCADVVNLWNSICISLPKVISLTQQRKDKISLRLNEMGITNKSELGKIEELFKRIEASGFLKGNGNKGWKANIDWLFRNPENWVKIEEGNYDDVNNQSKQALPKGFDKSKLGYGEYINDDGLRTYGTGKYIIPFDAPPRPGDGYSYSKSNNRWIY